MEPLGGRPHWTPTLAISVCMVALALLISAPSLEVSRGASLPSDHRPGPITGTGSSPNLASTSRAERALFGGSVHTALRGPRTENISVSGDPQGLTSDTGKGEIFVALYFGGVAIINDTANSVVAYLSTGGYTVGVAYDPAKGEVFVANSGSGAPASVINDTTNTVVANIDLGSQQYGVAYDRGMGEVFFSNGNNAVSVVNDTTNQVVATIGVGSGPNGLAYDPSNGEVFVANSDSDNVSIINGRTNQVVGGIGVEGHPLGVAYDSGAGELFVVNECGIGPTGECGQFIGTVSVISVSNDTVVATVPVGWNPQSVAYDRAAGVAYVSNTVPQSNNLTIINDTSNTATGSIPLASYGAGVAYDSDNDAVYVTNGSGVSVIFNEFTAQASASVTSGPAWLNVSFAGSAYSGSWNYTSWAWTLGDGTSSSLQNPSHTFTAPGVYEAFVKVTDSNGTTVASNVVTINVSAPRPFSMVQSRTSADVGQPLWFNTTTGGNVGALTYVYTAPAFAGCSFNDGATLECDPIGSGNFSVLLNVTNPLSEIWSLSSSEVMVSPPLSASVTVSNATLWLGDSVLISGFVRGGLTPYASYFAGLPPGCYQQTTDQIGCLPTESGNYSIQFTAQDANNAYASATQPLSVGFDFVVMAPSTATVGEAVTLRVDSAPGIGQLSYAYSNLPPGCSSQDSATLTCTPTKIGTYSILVSVHDQAGDHNAHTAVVKVVQGFLGLPGVEGYYLFAFIVGVTAVAIAVVSTRSRSIGAMTRAGELRSEAYAGYRKVAEEPGTNEVQLLSEGETDPASDLY
jgi:YVTN family beta-propeller protein